METARITPAPPRFTHVVPRSLDREAEEEPAEGACGVPLLRPCFFALGVEKLCRRVRGRKDASRRDRLSPGDRQAGRGGKIRECADTF